MPAQSKGATAARTEVGWDGVGEALIDDVVVRVSTHGDGAIDAIFGGVGEGWAFGAEVLFTTIAGFAVAAGVHDHADGRDVARLEFCYRFAGGGNAADDLVAGDHGIDGVAPLVAGHVQVRMADAAIKDFDHDFSGARLATAEIVRSQRRFGIECCVTLG